MASRTTIPSPLAAALALALALVPAACSGSRSAAPEAAVKEAERETANRVAQGHALVQQKRYDEAIDAFVQLAGEEDTRREAIDGAVEALVWKASGQRVPQRIQSALDLAKRLPPGAKRPIVLKTTPLLVDPVLEQTRQAARLLDSRRAFVESMRDNGEGDVMPTPEDRRVLTEGEVDMVRNRLSELEASDDVVRLYRFAKPLAAGMDRFLADDQRYLGQVEVTESQLEELEQSCDELGEALWPVQRQLDRMRPGWRRE